MSIRYGHSIRRALVVGVVAAMPVLCSGVAFASPTGHEIGPGSTDTAAVECVQYALASAARNGQIPQSTVVAVDGKYGPVTGKFVKTYQKKIGVADDGVVGPITGSRLYQEMRHDEKQGDEQLSRCFGLLPTTGDVTVPTT
jgi:peptidoglycan hydrolase-like protein with peptidoglycan-binding domain